MRLARLLVTMAIVATAGLMFGAQPAGACSCDAPGPDAMARSDGAFVGVLTGRDDPAGGNASVSSGTPVTYHFRVERVLKGDIGMRIDVVAAISGVSCGFELQPGDRSGLLVDRDGQTWKSGLCSQVKPSALSGGVPPALHDPAFFAAAAALAVASVGLAVVAARRRR